MKLSNFPPYKLVTDIISIVTSKEKLRQFWATPFYSNSVFIIVSGILNSLFSFAFWIVVARFYSPEDVGLASAVIAAIALLAGFAHLGLGIAIIRFLPQSDKDDHSLINTSFIIGALASVLGVVIFIAGLGIWSPALTFIRQSPVYIIIFSVITIASVLSSLAGETMVASRRAGFVTVQNLILVVLRLPLPILLAGLLHTFGIISSWGISLVISLFVCIFLLLPKARPGYRLFPSFNTRLLKSMIPYSLANYIGNIFWGIPSTVIPLLVLNLLGAEPTAYFSVVWAMVNAFTIFSGSLSLSLFVEGSHEENKLAVSIGRSIKLTLLISVPLVIVLMLVADKLLLLYGIEYSENGATLLRILVPGLIPSGITAIYLSIKRVEKKLKIIMGLTAFTALATIGLSYVLLPVMGINGVGVAWLSVQSITAIAMLFIWRIERRSLKAGGSNPGLKEN